MRREKMKPLSREERLKYEVARELGLMEKLMQVGWAGLTTAESGRIGGLCGARKKQRKET
ncbi:MAG: small, acid-soluble spore protein, alpha/beta type [Clostridia bacterium]|nr:small, acid-soluble spore protein, alpha/beta type [Clostridia bacterium]